MNPEDAAAARQHQQQAAGGDDKEGEVAGLSKAAKRNMKRKEKRKQQQAQGQQETSEEVETLGKELEKVIVTSEQNSTAAPAELSSTATEKAKKIKNLRKKLRQVEELQQKLDLGELQNPSKDQLDKLGRAQALRAEIKELEGDL